MIDLNLSTYLSQSNDTNELYYDDRFLATNANGSTFSDQTNFTSFLTAIPATAASIVIGSAETSSSLLFNGTSNDSIFKKNIDCWDTFNPTDKLNEFEFWVCGVVLNVVGILGIFGNILSMVILSRPQMRSSINYLLIGLARCDTALIITSILLFGIPSIYPYTGYLFYYYYVIYPNISLCLYPIAMAAQTSSVYMTFTVTLERYVAVCHPLKSRAICTYGRAKIYFIVCIFLAIVYNIPRFWEVIVEAYSITETDVIFCVGASDLRQNQIYIRIYIHWCYLIFIYIIPFFSLAILNCLIYRQVKKANRERQRLSRTEQREIGLARMLLCVVIVFFLFNFLALYTNILEAFYGIIDDYLIKTSNLLVTINSSTNFIIYVIYGEKFKRIFLLLFCKRRISKDAPDLNYYENSLYNNGEGTNRLSDKLTRHGTQKGLTRNGTTVHSIRISSTKIKRNQESSHSSLCDDYTKFSNTNNCELNTKNGLVTSGLCNNNNSSYINTVLVD